MNIVGSDKIGFILMPKHGSSTLEKLTSNYDFINASEVKMEETYQSERIFLLAWRDEFEAIKSGFFQDIKYAFALLFSDNFYYDEKLLYIFKYIFNKKNNINILSVMGGHRVTKASQDFFSCYLTDNDKFYFFDLKHLSNPKLIEWISERDERWKDVVISNENTSIRDDGKVKIKEILFRIKKELGKDYLDYKEIMNWTSFKYYYEFSAQFFESRKKSKQFLNFD